MAVRLSFHAVIASPARPAECRAIA
jgi:hypothetical protein